MSKQPIIEISVEGIIDTLDALVFADTVIEILVGGIIDTLDALV